MSLKRSCLIACSIAITALAACENKVIREGQYWQRVSASEAAFIQGPKAQQMLNRDIANCVVELRELERLGSLRNAIPTDVNGRVLNPDEKEMQRWDTPERDGQLLAEHGNYHDFEGCMLSHGWERVLYVPYDIAEKARGDYLRAHKDYEYESRFGERYKRKTTNEAAGYNE